MQDGCLWPYCRGLVEKINKKNKHANVKPFMVKNHLWVFINCSIENPAFDSQVLLHGHCFRLLRPTAHSTHPSQPAAAAQAQSSPCP
jgi:hypothetical protein